MSVPVFDQLVVFNSLDFAKQVALDVRHSVFRDHTVLRPFALVAAVKVGVECLSEEVEVDIVELQQVKHVHCSDGRH